MNARAADEEGAEAPGLGRHVNLLVCACSTGRSETWNDRSFQAEAPDTSSVIFARRT